MEGWEGRDGMAAIRDKKWEKLRKEERDGTEQEGRNECKGKTHFPASPLRNPASSTA